MVFEQIEALERQKAIWWAQTAGEIVQKLSEFHWACDGCLHSKRAIVGNPAKQKFCDHPPFLAYYDEEKTCNTCKRTFIFSASEQKHWYETLEFWVQSEAKDCLECRRKAREQKQLDTERSQQRCKVPRT